MSLPPGSQLAASPPSQMELSPERGVCRRLRGHVEGAGWSSWGAEVGLTPEESGLALRRFGLGQRGAAGRCRLKAGALGRINAYRSGKPGRWRGLGVVGRGTGGSGCRNC